MVRHITIATALAAMTALVGQVGANPIHLPRDGETCLEVTKWTMEWYGEPFLLGNADPVGEIDSILDSSSCRENACETYTSAAFEHPFAKPGADGEDLFMASYRIQIGQVTKFNGLPMKQVMKEAMNAGIRKVSSWENVHWQTYARSGAGPFGGDAQRAKEGWQWQMTLPGNAFLLSYEDINGCSAYSIRVDFIDTDSCGAWSMTDVLAATFGFSGITIPDGTGDAWDEIKRLQESNAEGNIRITTDNLTPKC